MEFGKHIGKGLWAFADKALPAVYALGFIFLVVRVLPEKEYGSFALLQSVFLIISSLGYALALQPLTKFAAETADNGPYIVASLVVNALFYGLVSVAVYLFAAPIAAVIDATGEGNFVALAAYLPLLLLTSYYRSFAGSLLQAKYEIRKIFWIDATYFLGTFVLIIIAQRLGHFHTAADMVILNVYGQAASSVVGAVLTRKPMQVKLEARRDAFRKMWDFGKYSFGANATYIVSAQFDIFFVSSYAGVVALATYGAAKTLTRVFDMLSQVLQMFLLPASSKFLASGERDKLRQTIEKSISFSTILFLPVLVVLCAMPTTVLHLLYGGKYDGGAAIVAVFGLLAVITPWAGVAASVLVGMGKTRLGFYLGLLFTLCSVILYYVLVPSLGNVGAAWAYVGTVLVIAVVLSYYLRKFITFDLLCVFTRFKDARAFAQRSLGR